MTKIVAFLLITSGLLACQRSHASLNLQTRVLCVGGYGELSTYSLSELGEQSAIQSIVMFQRILDHRLIASNGRVVRILAALEATKDPSRAQIVIAEFDLRTRSLHKQLLAVAPSTSSTFFTVSSNRSFALIPEEKSYLLYDLQNRQRVRSYRLNPKIYKNPRISDDGEYALFAHIASEKVQRQMLVSLITGEGLQLLTTRSQNGPIDAHFLGSTAIVWKEAMVANLMMMSIADLKSSKWKVPTSLMPHDGGNFTGFVSDDKAYVAVAGKASLRIVEIDLTTASVTKEENYDYPFSVGQENATIQFAPWANELFFGLNRTGRNLSFHTGTKTWLFQNCFFAQVGPETILEIYE